MTKLTPILLRAAAQEKVQPLAFRNAPQGRLPDAPRQMPLGRWRAAPQRLAAGERAALTLCAQAQLALTAPPPSASEEETTP